jgi:predicted TIM-barrel fold metal-dependent hydrolase
MIVDPHVHVWVNDPAYPWPAENADPPKRDHTVEMLLDIMATHGVDRAVLVHAIHYRWDNRYAVDSANKYPDRFMSVGRIDPEDPEAPDHLSRWTEECGMHGVRISPAGDASGDWFSGPLMEPLFARAEELQVPMLLWTKANRLAELIPLLERHPDLDVVIDHMGHVQGAEETKLLLNLARFPRLYVKISHLYFFSGAEYPWAGAHALVQQVYDTFGAQRLMWDSDWPVSLSAAEYGQTLSAVRDEMGFISSEDMPWILGKTAMKLWDFKGRG